MRRTRALATLLAVALAPLPALAQSAAQPHSGPYWYQGPGGAAPGHSRVKLVFDATRAAALSPEQYWDYAAIYKSELVSRSMRMSMPAARAGARTAAIDQLAARNSALRVQTIGLDPIDGPRLAPRY